MQETTADLIRRAAGAIGGADALLIGAGAGMGVDSGLPDFRGSQGFWRAYPPYARLGLGFAALADPRWFRDDPPLAWGFYGHRLGLYRRTRPHPGFELLRDWAGRMPRGGFVFTSNVDGQFQRRRFRPQPGRRGPWVDPLDAMHGGVRVGIFTADPYEVGVDEETMRAIEPLPACPGCGALARPNILMFGDGVWDGFAHRCPEGPAAAMAGWRYGVAGSWWSSAAPGRRSRRSACAARTSPTGSTGPWCGSTLASPKCPMVTSRCLSVGSKRSGPSKAGSGREPDARRCDGPDLNRFCGLGRCGPGRYCAPRGAQAGQRDRRTGHRFDRGGLFRRRTALTQVHPVQGRGVYGLGTYRFGTGLSHVCH